MRRLMILACVLMLAGCEPRVGQEYRVAETMRGLEDKAEFRARAPFANLVESPARNIKPGVLYAEAGIRVRVLDTCPDGVRLEILDGDKSGKAAWFKPGKSW